MCSDGSPSAVAAPSRDACRSSQGEKDVRQPGSAAQAYLTWKQIVSRNLRGRDPHTSHAAKRLEWAVLFAEFKSRTHRVGTQKYVQAGVGRHFGAVLPRGTSSIRLFSKHDAIADFGSDPLKPPGSRSSPHRPEGSPSQPISSVDALSQCAAPQVPAGAQADSLFSKSIFTSPSGKTARISSEPPIAST